MQFTFLLTGLVVELSGKTSAVCEALRSYIPPNTVTIGVTKRFFPLSIFRKTTSNDSSLKPFCPTSRRYLICGNFSIRRHPTGRRPPNRRRSIWRRSVTNRRRSAVKARAENRGSSTEFRRRGITTPTTLTRSRSTPPASFWRFETSWTF